MLTGSITKKDNRHVAHQQNTRLQARRLRALLAGLLASHAHLKSQNLDGLVTSWIYKAANRALLMLKGCYVLLGVVVQLGYAGS